MIIVAVRWYLTYPLSYFELREICFDPWNSRQISASLVTKGYICVEIRQDFATLSEPSKKLLELVEPALV